MKAKEIVLLIFIIIAGIFFYHAKTGKLDWAWQLGDFGDWAREPFVFEESLAIEPPLPSLLKVVNSHGNVEIEGIETEEIRLTMVKRVWRRREAEAEEIAARLHSVVAKDQAALTIGTNREEFKRRNFETDLRIRLPREMTIEVRNRHGLVKAFGVASAEILNPHGQVVVHSIPGSLKIENSFEDVEAEDIQSDCEIRSKHATIEAARIAGETRIENSHGGIRLRRIGRKIAIDATHTEIRGEDLSGPLKIKNSYEPISLLRVGPAAVEGHHCRIEAVEINGDVVITTSYEPIELRRVRGNVHLTGKSAAIKGHDIVAGEIVITTSYEPVELSDFSGKTIILLSHGELTLRPLALMGPIEAQCEYSPILLYWPGEEPYPLEARAKSSDILWRIGGDISIEEKEGWTVGRAFLQAQDRPLIRLITTYNDIRVEKGAWR